MTEARLTQNVQTQPHVVSLTHDINDNESSKPPGRSNVMFDTVSPVMSAHSVNPKVDDLASCATTSETQGTEGMPNPNQDIDQNVICVPKYAHTEWEYQRVLTDLTSDPANRTWVLNTFAAANNLLEYAPRWAAEVVQAFRDTSSESHETAEKAAQLWRSRRADQIHFIANIDCYSPVDLPLHMVFEGENIHYNQDPELERRYAVTSLRSIVNNRLNKSGYDSMSIADAVLTMGRTRWQFEAAISMWVTPDIARQWTVLFDQFSLKPQHRNEADRRLALFVSITGCADWYSAQVLLWNVQWGLKAALVR